MKSKSFKLFTILLVLNSSCNNEYQYDEKEREKRRIMDSIDANIERARNGGLNPDDFKDDDDNYIFQDTTDSKEVNGLPPDIE